MSAQLTLRHPAGAYRALAALLSIEDHDVVGAVTALACVPCPDSLLRARDDEATRDVLGWIVRGQVPELKPELERLFGSGFCKKGLAAVPACAAFYIEDVEPTRKKLLDAYSQCGFSPSPQFNARCEGVTYISQQLAFVGHCMETGRFDSDTGIRTLLRHSLFEWAPLFARALVGATIHPAVIFAGVKLETVLSYESSAASQ